VTCAIGAHALPSTKLIGKSYFLQPNRHLPKPTMLPTLLLIEDQMLLTALLVPKLADKFQVVTANTFDAALLQLQAQKFDLVLLDLKLDKSGVLQGLNLLPALKASGTPVIVVSAHCTGAAPILCLRGGIRAFVDKIHSTNGLLPVIETVMSGKKSLPTEWRTIHPANLSELNASALLVLEKILADPSDSNQAIANKIYLSLATVKKNMTTLLRFFHCDNRYELAYEVERCGFVPDLQLAKRC
jgi:DNA-binding NarL/FixJ family response regulator